MSMGRHPKDHSSGHDAQSSADKIARILLTIETAQSVGFCLTPLVVHDVTRQAQPRLIFRIGGDRYGLDLDEAGLLTRCMRDEQAFPGVTVLAGLIDNAAFVAQRMLAPGYTAPMESAA